MPTRSAHSLADTSAPRLQHLEHYVIAVLAIVVPLVLHRVRRVPEEPTKTEEMSVR